MSLPILLLKYQVVEAVFVVSKALSRNQKLADDVAPDTEDVGPGE